MSMDGLSLLAVTHELQGLVGGKIDKVQQPERDALLLTIRSGGSNHRLLLCAHPENGRVQVTAAQFPNPPEPPAFCMLLRKRLSGGRIAAIEQPGLDRVLRLTAQVQDELGDLTRVELIVELMGRHSNIIFLSEQGVILDCARHVGAGMSSVRLLLPGLNYTLPPQQDKRDPRECEAEDFERALSGPGRIHKLLSNAFFGLSPAYAALLCGRVVEEGDMDAARLSDEDRKALSKSLSAFYQDAAAGRFSPTLVYNDLHEPVAVHPFRPAIPNQYLRAMPDMGTALDVYYETRDVLERIRRRSTALQKVLQNNLERCQKKLSVFETALNQQESLDQYRLLGELITANFHAIKRGERMAKLMNYYEDPPAPVLVALDERLSPQENAQRYFKKYQKGKAAKALAVEQRRQTLEEIAYLEGQQDNLQKCSTDAELSEIREELELEGYAKRQNTRMKPQKRPPSKPHHYMSSDGIDLYVGKNNAQNDALTLKFATGENFWLHTKNIPGSHVIIRHEGEPPERTLREAATLAAFYSKARASASVPVDYCPRKYVKKPSGAKPGMVIYTANRTIYITPDEAAVKRLTLVE